MMRSTNDSKKICSRAVLIKNEPIFRAVCDFRLSNPVMSEWLLQKLSKILTLNILGTQNINVIKRLNKRFLFTLGSTIFYH